MAELNAAIRIAVPSDARGLLEIYAPYVEKTAITFEYSVPSAEEFSARIAKTLEKYPYLVAEENGELLGYAYTSAFHERAAYSHCAELSIYLRGDMRRRGLGRRFYAALESISNAQNIHNLYACIGSPAKESAHLDRSSEQFHKRIGYSYVGRFQACGYKFGEWYDMVYMEKRISAPRQPQPPFVPFPALTEDVFRRTGVNIE